MPCALVKRGTRTFITMHVLLPGEWTVRRGHDLAELVELDVRKGFNLCTYHSPSGTP
jgi:divalent metal cation (Fe/Co/Zn/Cd) transporter